MPEEINRIVTDALSDYLFTTEASAEANLLREGIPQNRIFFCGNVMIDTLVRHLPEAEAGGAVREDSEFALVTLHRPSNVDARGPLSAIVAFLSEIAGLLTVLFPIHPRTLNHLEEFGLLDDLRRSGIRLLPPLGYIENLGLMRRARFVLTDSGGIQEETSYLSVPCLTLRENTERPVTISHGTNTLVGSDFRKARALVADILSHKYRTSCPIPGWDGRAAERVVEAVSTFLEARRRDVPAHLQTCG